MTTTILGKEVEEGRVENDSEVQMGQRGELESFLGGRWNREN